MLRQAAYVRGEVDELNAAVDHYLETGPVEHEQTLRSVRHEIADVVLAAVTLAGMLGLQVEDCIADKTEFDRDRG